MLLNRLWGRSLPPEERDYIENMKKEIENVQRAMSGTVLRTFLFLFVSDIQR